MKLFRCRLDILSLILSGILLTGVISAFANVPKTMSYQGMATDELGTPLPDGEYSFRFQLWDHPVAGTILWDEFTPLTTTSGLFTHQLGSITPIPDSVFTKYDSLYLAIHVGPQGLSPRIPVASVGYARRVGTLDGASGGDVTGSVTLRDVTYDELKVSLNASPGSPGNISIARGDGYWGMSISGQPYLGLWGPDRLAWFDLSESGSASVVLPSNAIQASEMLDEPGVGSDNTASVTLTGTPQFLAGRTMTAPTDGYVLVIATAHASILHTNGTQSTCILGLSDDMSSYVNSTMSRISLPSIMPSAIYEFPLATQAIFPISAGSQAYYVLGSRTGTTSAVVYDVQLSEVFFPTAYTTVSAPTPLSGSADISSAPFDPDAERLESESFNRKRLEDELARISAELEAVKEKIQPEAPAPSKD